MVKHLVVPMDESPSAWHAFDVAVAMARRVTGTIRVVEVVDHPSDVHQADKRLEARLRARDHTGVDVSVEIRALGEHVADEVVSAAEDRLDSVIVMSSHGKGRSAGIVGSVSEDILRRTSGPVVLVGHHVEPSDFSGPVVVSVDGSNESEVALPVAAEWASLLDTTPWIVHVADPGTDTSADADVVESAYPAHLARSLSDSCGRPVEYDELHGRRAAEAVPEYATRHGASLIVASSHGRSGLSRLTMGSVTAGFVRRATCPIVIVRFS